MSVEAELLVAVGAPLLMLVIACSVHIPILRMLVNSMVAFCVVALAVVTALSVITNVTIVCLAHPFEERCVPVLRVSETIAESFAPLLAVIAPDAPTPVHALATVPAWLYSIVVRAVMKGGAKLVSKVSLERAAAWAAAWAQPPP